MDKWDPLKDIFSLRDRVNKLFEDSPARAGRAGAAAWMPVVDFYENIEGFVALAELPGVAESDISIEVEDSTLRISGDRKPHREGKNYHQVERCSGVFSRSFLLPASVDKENIKAALKDGMLKITLPKRNDELPKCIEIK